tara:strand:- start:650 stop:754 length:105 start_codon:yes stop_codon:yes gene_type:complete
MAMDFIMKRIYDNVNYQMIMEIFYCLEVFDGEGK